MFSEDNIGLLFRRIHLTIRQRADHDLKEYGLTMPQARVLLSLAHRKGEKTTPRDLEDIFQVSQPTMAGIIKRLERNGFLTTATDPDDRRSKMIFPTQKATDFCQKVVMGHSVVSEQLLKGFSEEEAQQFRQMLSRIIRNLEPKSPR